MRVDNLADEVAGGAITKVTETVYRKQLRPVLTAGTDVMESLFDSAPAASKEPLGLVG